MKWALLSDIHANLHALEACLAHARSHGAQQWAVLGDLVGYGAHPAEVVALVADLQAHGAVVVRGNHDQPPPDAAPTGGPTMAHATAAWTWAQLDTHATGFLAQLPLTAWAGEVLLTHASADHPERWTYVDNPHKASRCWQAALHHGKAQGVLVGHVHHQHLYYPGAGQQMMVFNPTAGVPVPLRRNSGFVATVGSVGQPRDGDTRAMYAMYDQQTARLTFHRVPYDHLAAAAAVRKAGLQEVFAARLEAGR